TASRSPACSANTAPGSARPAIEGQSVRLSAGQQRPERRSNDGQPILKPTRMASGQHSDLEFLVELWGFEPQTSCMPSKIPWVHWPAARPAGSAAAAVTAPAAGCGGQKALPTAGCGPRRAQPQRTAAVTGIRPAGHARSVTLTAEGSHPGRRSDDGQMIFLPARLGKE